MLSLPARGPALAPPPPTHLHTCPTLLVSHSCGGTCRPCARALSSRPPIRGSGRVSYAARPSLLAARLVTLTLGRLPPAIRAPPPPPATSLVLILIGRKVSVEVSAAPRVRRTSRRHSQLRTPRGGFLCTARPSAQPLPCHGEAASRTKLGNPSMSNSNM